MRREQLMMKVSPYYLFVQVYLHESNSEPYRWNYTEYSSRKKRKLFNPKLLPKEYKYLDRDEVEELSLWDDPNDKPTQLKVTCFKESLEPPSALPITSQRPPEKQIVGYAAQSFNQPEIPGVMSGWVSTLCIFMMLTQRRTQCTIFYFLMSLFTYIYM